MDFKPHPTYGQFLRSITQDSWPSREDDPVWREARYWQDQGVDLATEIGRPLKVTFLGRLAKNARINGTSHDAERAAPFMHLAKLTGGRALAPQFRESWTPISTSYSVRVSDPAFYEHILAAFLYKRKPDPGTVADESKFTWDIMVTKAITLDRRDLLETLLEIAPKGVHPLPDILYGGPRIFQWLLDNHGQDLIDNAPVENLPYAGNMGLHKYLSSRGFDSFPMKKLMEAWVAEARMDQKIPQAVDSGAFKPRIRL